MKLLLNVKQEKANREEADIGYDNSDVNWRANDLC